MLLLSRYNRRPRNPRPGRRLSRGFLAVNGNPTALWIPTLGIGPRAYDFAQSGLGIGNVCALNGGVQFQPVGWGVFGQSWKFNGTNQYISSAYLGITGTSPRWVAVVFSTTSVSGAGTNAAISWGDNTGLIAGGIWDVDIESGVIWLRAGSGVTANFGSGYNDGKWHLMVLTMPSGAKCNQVECSVDGVSLAGTFANGTTAINTSAVAGVQIGRMTTNNNYFSGSIAFAAIGSSYMPVSTRSSLYSALRTGEPYTLFAASPNERFMASFAAPAGSSWPWFISDGFGYLIGA